MKRTMLFVWVCAAVASALTSCGVNSPREFADRFIEAEKKAWSTGEVQDLKALEDADVIYHLPGMDVVGWDAHEDYILQGRPTISNLRQDWKYLSGEGNHFALSYDSSATVRANADSTAMAVSANYLFIFRLENGKVREVWTNGTTTNTPVEGN